MGRFARQVIGTEGAAELTVIEGAHGTLNLVLERLDGLALRGLRAICFGLNTVRADEALSVEAGAAARAGSLGAPRLRARLSGPLRTAARTHDVGIVLDNSPNGPEIGPSARFRLSHDTIALDLGMIDLSAAELVFDGEDTARARPAPARRAPLPAAVSLFDAAEGLTVLAVQDRAGPLPLGEDGFERAVMAGERMIGLLTLTLDGVARFAPRKDGAALPDSPLALRMDCRTVATDGAMAGHGLTLALAFDTGHPVLTLERKAPRRADCALRTDLRPHLRAGPLGARNSVILAAPTRGRTTLDGTVLGFDPAGEFDDLAPGQSRSVCVVLRAMRHILKTTITLVTLSVTGSDTGPLVQLETVETDPDGLSTGQMFPDRPGPGARGTQVLQEINGTPVRFGSFLPLASGRRIVVLENGDYLLDSRDLSPSAALSSPVERIEITLADPSGQNIRRDFVRLAPGPVLRRAKHLARPAGEALGVVPFAESARERRPA